LYRSKQNPAAVSLPFFYHNTNKQGVVLDLHSSIGKRSLRALIAKADVLVETLSHQGVRALGLDREQSLRINSRLIHISITGFGRTGPKSRFHSSDSVASAYGGQMNLSGTATGPPVKLFGNQPGYVASLFAANSVLLSLVRRRATGKGCYFDLSVQESVASTLDHVMIDYFHRGKTTERRQGTPSSESFAVFPCKDGTIQIPPLRNFETLLQLMNSEGRAGNLLGNKWRTESYRNRHLTQITEAIADWTANHTRRELFELGQAMQFPWAPICAPGEVLRSPQLKARRFFIPVRIHRSKTTGVLPGVPYRFDRMPPSAPAPAPLLGEHTQRVLKRLQPGNENDPVLHSDRRGSRYSVKSGDILSGIRVVDFTRMLSGPYATRILGDFGAEVIKIQSKSTAQGAERNDTPYFSAWNRNKRSVCLNLNHPEARRLILQLIACSDIVVENFSPRVMANWGLTRKRLKQIKPDLIMASISAMGHSGPWKNFVGFAPTFHALSGLIAQSAHDGHAPVRIGHSYGDVIAGLYAAIAILSSLEFRSRTGKGQYIDMSAYEAMCTLLGPALMGEHPALKHSLRREAQDAPCGCYPCAGNDKWCVITIANEAQWRSLRRISGLPELMSDKFSTKARRLKNRSELDNVIARWTICYSANTVARRLQKEGIAAGVVQNAEALARDNQLASRRFFVSMEHPVLGATHSDRSALWPWRENPAAWKAAPQLGEDNHYVFVELLGRSEAEYRSLVKKGIIGS
jgi:crotonobetainyl-CoA:carnitine CoA-transferase CaiB-like acyl-CoA transferase